MIATADAAGARGSGRRWAAGSSPATARCWTARACPGSRETVIAGDEGVIERAVRAYAEAGATELVASLHGSDQEKARTLELLAALRGGLTPDGAAPE